MSFPRYPKYKDSGVEWLGEVPEHWASVRLKNLLAEVDDRVGEQPLELLGLSKSIGVVPRSQLEQGASQSDDYGKYKIAQPGQLVMNKMQAWNGVFGLSPSLGMVSPDYAVFRFLRESAAAFLCSLFRTDMMAGVFYTRCRGMGTAFLRLNTPDLLDIKVPLPPPNEQTAIAAFLDRETAKIDGLVGEQRRLMELLKEKRQAVISHAVTKGLNPHAPMKPSGIEWLGDVPQHWGIASLRYYATFCTGSTPDRDTPAFWNGAIPWVKTGEINYTTIMETEEAISQLGLDSSSCSIAPPGTLLMALYGQGVTRGRVAHLGIHAAFNQACAAITVDTRLSSEFLHAFFVFAYSFIRDGNETTQMNLNIEFVRRVRIVVPPLPEQRAIAEYVETEGRRFDALTAEAQQAIDLLQERRTALISAAVTGKIEVCEVIATSLPPRKSYTSWFARQLLAAEILHKCHAHPTTGRVKVQKLIHLCEHVAEIEEIHGSYARKAAGPFDHKVMFGIANGLKKLKWFAEEKRQGRTVYRPLEKAGAHAKYLARWNDKLPRVHLVLELLGKADTQQCEIVSTLYAAWNDLIIEGKAKAVTDSAIIYEASNPERWHENKALIPADKWPIALQWMRDKGLIPTGFGGLTKRAQPSSSEDENGVA